MKTYIDINSDVGERSDALLDGSEEKLIQLVSSVNIACGMHAGDAYSMGKVLRYAMKYDVGIGAHPSYPDRKNFGRKEMQLSADEIANCVFDQVALLVEIAKKSNRKITHVKPHGALYNSAVKNPDIAKAIADGILRVDKQLILVGLAGSPMLDVWRDMGFKAVGEAFADRLYEPDGSLRLRHLPDALITDPNRAAKQALSIVQQEVVVTSNGTKLKTPAETICLHSDTPNSLAIAEEIRQKLEEAGVEIRSLAKPVEQ